MGHVYINIIGNYITNNNQTLKCFRVQMIFERKQMDCSAVNMPAICTILYRNLAQSELELLIVYSLMHNQHYF